MDAFEEISIHGVHQLLAGSEVTIVDIRDENSYRQAHIQGAIHLRDETIETFLKETEKDKPLICYCYHGISSRLAAQFLKSKGFSKVFSMAGGFEEWRKQR